MNNGLRSALFLGAGLVAGFAVATLLQPDDGDRERWASAAETPLDARLASLERLVAAEAAARRALSEELDALRSELAEASLGAAAGERAATGALRAPRLDGPVARDPSADPAPTPGVEDEDDDDRRRVRRGPPTPEELEQRRMQRFVDAGFTPDRAAWIEQRTAQLQMQRLEAEYEAARSGDPSALREVPSVEEALRAELGDAEYERYLNAVGRPTRIAVRNVLPSSPAALVGLQPGDEIVAYGGQRVFDMGDLNRLTLEGQPGETVVMEVIRDGQPIQVFVPRGPIGISGGRRFP